ncbi:class I SAM-dependent methyltransferase [soil metagenome]
MLNKKEINNFYREKLKEYGASAEGMGWRDTSSQEIRFKQLIKVIDSSIPFSINDVGSGSGDLITLLKSEFKDQFSYSGYDNLKEMTELAKKQFPESKTIKFKTIKDYADLDQADYSVASGIFNVKNSIDASDWQQYILATITTLSLYSRKGFAFNALTSYSDTDKMKSDLYYSDPLFLFDYCKTKFSKNVALLHDYGIYDFTILVRKE